MPETIFVVDDDEFMRAGMVETLAVLPHETRSFERAQDALEALSDGSASVLITDMRMPGMDGMELLQKALKADPKLPVIMMTAFATVETAVEAMKKGAFDYVMKPFDSAQIEIAVQKAFEYRRLRVENEYLRKELAGRWSLEDFVGTAPAMQDVFEKVRQVAASNATVFIRGESGTGKELVARAVHAQSPRREKPMVRVNCAALSAGVLESELFGHEKGAFTGADRRRIGRFEMAEGGTIFLDEVSEMDLALQGKLLRVLQEKEFERVGSSQTIRADVRILASSNRDLQDAIREGLFRQDLYYRLNVVSIELPPLRKRKEDIRPLVQYFIEKYNREEGTHVRRASDEALSLMENYEWPGNVRELENLIERAIVLGSEEVIPAALIGGSLERTPGGPTPDAAAAAWEPRLLEEVEREHVLRVLSYHDGHRLNSAQTLGISERSLRDRLKRWKEAGLIEDA